MKQPLLYILLPLMMGIFLGHTTQIATIYLSIVLAGFLIISFPVFYLTSGKKSLLTEFLFLAVVFVFGLFRIRLSEENLDPHHISNFPDYYNKQIAVIGIIDSQPEIRKENLVFQFDLTNLLINQDQPPLQGKIQVYLRVKNPILKYGDKLKLAGRFKRAPGQRNPGAFDYAEYLELKKIHGLLWVSDSSGIQYLAHEPPGWLFENIVYPLKHFLSRKIDQIFEMEVAIFFKAIFLGKRQQITPDFQTALSQTGTSHILAVSGLHTGFILLIIWLFLRFLRLPSQYTAFLSIIGLMIFAMITDLKAPVVRASIMAGVFLMGVQFQKFRNGYNTLALAALIILLINPLELFQIGFQLSFMAVLSILYLYPRLRHFIQKIPLLTGVYCRKWLKYVLDLFLISLAVQIGTLPITLSYFFILPFFGILANIFVIPLVGLILSLGIVSLLFSLISSWLASFYGEVVEFLVWCIKSGIHLMANLPGSHFYIPQPGFASILLYFTFILVLTQWTNYRLRKICIIFILLTMNFTIWKSIFFNAPQLTILNFDVGQGDAALIQFPDGPNVLIDAGEANADFDAGQRIISPYFLQNGIYHLDYMIITHPHNDHIGGIPSLMKNFSVGQIILSPWHQNSPEIQRILKLADSLKIQQKVINRGEILQISPGSEIWILHPPLPDKNENSHFIELDKNNASVVIKIIYGQNSFLFMGDSEYEAETLLLPYENLLQSNYLKVGHHGSISSTSSAILNYIKPNLAVISVGEYNKFNQPSPVIISRLKSNQVQILRTDLDQAILLKSDGQRIQRIIWKEKN
ncbi:DNA internalization-related competence protein ComEC/Rec2 [candidate division KSB1 bacterium]|nr:DNA internalization-related competence protein ComEC/Rec2 [candidate division KSB1 bacterium]